MSVRYSYPNSTETRQTQHRDTTNTAQRNDSREEEVPVRTAVYAYTFAAVPAAYRNHCSIACRRKCIVQPMQGCMEAHKLLCCFPVGTREKGIRTLNLHFFRCYVSRTGVYRVCTAAMGSANAVSWGQLLLARYRTVSHVTNATQATLVRTSSTAITLSILAQYW